MVQICDLDKCTGCAACYNVCPFDAITLIPNKSTGANIPYIHTNLCVDCLKCKNVCPVNNKIDRVRPIRAYAAFSLDSDDRSSSTSGGVASVFSNEIISQKGVVYGAIVGKGGTVFHDRISDVDCLAKLKGSKYVQSDIRDCYKRVKSDLNSGIHVLFIGTPCQIAGLKSALNKKFDNLLTVDLICHGVPSPQILKDHIRMVSKSNISSLSFRSEGKYLLKFIDDNNSIVYRKSFPWDNYLCAFTYNLTFRDSCYSCNYSNDKRVSDITIGDFWGLGRKDKISYSPEKVSVILINTAKGKVFLATCKDKLFLDERNVDEAIEGNHNLISPSTKHKYHHLFRVLYPRFGYKIAIKVSLSHFYIKHIVYRIIRKFGLVR